MTGSTTSQDNLEPDNIVRLGKHAFVYGFLLLIGSFGMLALLTTAGVPLDGTLGGIEIERLVLRLCTAAAWLLSAHAWIAFRQDREPRYRQVMRRLLFVGSVFLMLSVDYGDTTDFTIRLLQAIDGCCSAHANTAVAGLSQASGQAPGLVFGP